VAVPAADALRRGEVRDVLQAAPARHRRRSPRWRRTTTSGSRAARGRTPTRIRPVRYAVEIRHESFETSEFVDLLRAHDVALVLGRHGRPLALRGRHHQRLRLRPPARRRRALRQRLHRRGPGLVGRAAEGVARRLRAARRQALGQNVRG
jgi:hypothetical protein